MIIYDAYGVYAVVYLTGTVADVVEDCGSAVLVIDTGCGQYRFRIELALLRQALAALYGEGDCVGKAVAVQYDGSSLLSIEVPGIPPDYVI